MTMEELEAENKQLRERIDSLHRYAVFLDKLEDNNKLGAEYPVSSIDRLKEMANTGVVVLFMATKYESFEFLGRTYNLLPADTISLRILPNHSVVE